MISFRCGHHRFHLRAAAIVLDDHHLLLHRLEGEAFWALPGGRVNPGESAQQALAREFKEELSTSVEVGALCSTGENFFDDRGEAFHELGLYFAVRLPTGSPLADKSRTHIGQEGHKALEFRWFALSDLPSLDFHPRALRSSLCTGQWPAHFVQRG